MYSSRKQTRICAVIQITLQWVTTKQNWKEIYLVSVTHKNSEEDDDWLMYHIKRSDIMSFDEIFSVWMMASQHRPFKLCIRHTWWLLTQINVPFFFFSFFLTFFCRQSYHIKHSDNISFDEISSILMMAFQHLPFKLYIRHTWWWLTQISVPFFSLTFFCWKGSQYT